ncbi:hypothetical protein ES708_14874 [subsurface metagenome]
MQSTRFPNIFVLWLFMICVLTTSAFGQWQYNGSDIYYNGGKVGIGTSNPGAKLHVADPNFPVIRAERTGLTTDSGVWATIGALATKTSTAGDNFGCQLLCQFKDTGGGPYNLGGVGFVRDGGDRKGKFVVQNNDGVGSDSWTQNLVVEPGGNVGIGTTNPQSRLAVNGTITAKEVNVTTSGWPDYVFDRGYPLRPISEVEAYILQNGRLPGVPSASDVEKKGVSLGENQAILLRKIEEMTLYMIETQKKMAELHDENEALKERVAKLEE